ncbi:MAG: EamA family transporter [Candidatus Daviesbacteria bacterium]|nr:EamA family transporter [Candidatus Daviesbacteria bacterium]
MKKITEILHYRNLWPYVAIILAFTIWGINYIVAKLTLQEIPPMSLAFLRFFIASLFLVPFLLFEKKKVKIDKNDLPRLIGIGLLTITFSISFFYLGIARTRAIDASALSMSVPVLSVLFAWVFLKEKIFTINLVGLASGLIGAIIILGVPLALAGLGFNPQAMIGNLLILMGNISWVLGAILSRQLLKKYSTLTITSILFLIGTITFLGPAVREYLLDPSWPNNLTYLGLLGLTYIALLSSIVAFFLFEWSLKKLGVVKADLFQYIEPPIAAILAYFVLAEKLDPSFIFGITLIIIGVYWGTLGRDNHKHPKYHRT